jgi:hypothetical protein
VPTWGSFFECQPAASRSGEAGFSKKKKKRCGERVECLLCAHTHSSRVLRSK